MLSSSKRTAGIGRCNLTYAQSCWHGHFPPGLDFPELAYEVSRPCMQCLIQGHVIAHSVSLYVQEARDNQSRDGESLI